MRRKTRPHPFAVLAHLFLGVVASSFSTAHAQYAQFQRGSNLEHSRVGEAVKASMAVADDGGVAVLACVAQPESRSPSPYLVLWKLRADGSPQWSRAWGFNQFRSTLSSTSPTLNLAFAHDGGLIMTGAFAGSIDFGGGPLVSANYDIFLAKLDANGNHVWSRSFGAAGNDLAYQLLVNSAGDITVAGKHTGVDFGGGRLEPGNALNLFRATFAPDGTRLNDASFGATEGTASINDMAISPAGDVYAIGGSDWMLKFGTTILDRVGSNDIVMVGFDPLGNVQMAQRFGGESFDTGCGIVLTPEGDVITTGVFSGYISVGGPVLGSCHAFNAVYVAGYSADGAHLWSSSTDPCAYGTFWCTDIALHPSGGFVVGGYFTGGVQFGQVSLYARAESMLTMYFDGNGDLIWMGKGAAEAKGLSVAVKPDGNVAVAGSNNLDLYFCSGQIMKTANARGFVAEFSDEPHIDTLPPPVPANPRCDGTTVSWDESIDPDGASVRYRVEQIRYFNYSDRVTMVNGTSMPLNAAENLNDFVYVTAIDCFDHESAPSVRAEIHPAKWGPLRPENVHFEGGSLAWTNPTDADVVGVAVDGTYTWGGVADTVRLATTMATTLNVENLSYRYYYIRGIDASGNRGDAAMVTDQAPPPAPTGLAYALPKLTWDASKDVGFGGFEIYGSKFSDFSKERHRLGATRGTEFEVPIEQRDSYYHIVQFDRSGNSSAPATVAGQGGARPAPPRALAYRDAQLSWKTDDTDIDRYDVYASATDASEGPRVLLGSTGALDFDVSQANSRWFYVIAIDVAGQESEAAIVSAITGKPPSFTLSLGALPNPFRNATTLQYSLPTEGRVKIAIYDLRGAHVVTLVNGLLPRGSHYVEWTGESDNRGEATTGVYFARMQFNRRELTAKLVLLR